ncbi:hypothetical protein BGX24_006462 [Mortierella sp. AD032]|nr:hypothetical protein BGX24_006462 [Mortierella sp. AD032]
MNPATVAMPIGASTSSAIRRVATTAALRSTTMRSSTSSGLRFYTAATTRSSVAHHQHKACTNTLRKTLYSSSTFNARLTTPTSPLTTTRFGPIIRRGFANQTSSTTASSAASGTTVAATTTPQKAGVMDKIKQLVKQYGYTGVAVYLAISTLDLAATFVIVKAAGMEKIEKAQDWVLENIGHYFGYKAKPHTHTTEEDLDKMDDEQVGAIYNKASGLWSVFVIAYGIHKLLVPLRVVATSMITPPLVKWLVKRGWIKEVAKKGAVASGATGAAAKVGAASAKP